MSTSLILRPTGALTETQAAMLAEGFQMSTSLILRPTGALTETQAAMLAEMDREGDAGFDFQPLRLKFPTGGSTAAFTLSDEDLLRVPVEMIVAVSQRTRGYWPTVNGKKVLGKSPLCSSRDGVEGQFDPKSESVQAALGTYVRHPALGVIDPEVAKGPWECVNCPLAKWESAGENERGQACKAMRKLLVVIKGWAMPAVLTLPPTSIKVWDSFASGMRQRGQTYFSRWVTVELEKHTGGDSDYAVLKIKPSAQLTDPESAEVMAIRAQFGDLVRRMDITSDDYATEDAENAAARAYTQTPVDDEDIPF